MVTISAGSAWMSPLDPVHGKTDDRTGVEPSGHLLLCLGQIPGVLRQQGAHHLIAVPEQAAAEAVLALVAQVILHKRPGCAAGAPAVR